MTTARADDIDMYYEVHASGDPLVLIGGLAGDRVVPLREAESMHRGIAGSKMVTFNGGHIFFVMRERLRFLECVAAAMAA
jgi:hypothetical protein